MGVSRFEDLVAWQKARVLTRDVYGVTMKGQFARDLGLSGQIQRASVSAPPRGRQKPAVPASTNGDAARSTQHAAPSSRKRS